MFLRLLAAAMLLSLAGPAAFAQEPAASSPSPQQSPEAGGKARPPLPDKERIAREALKVKDILQKDGVIFVTWQDPYPLDRTYYLQKETLSTKANLVKHQLRDLDSAPASKFNTEQKVSTRAKLEAELAKVEKDDKVVSVWSKLDDVKFSKTEAGLHQASFPAPKVGKLYTVRIASVSPDGKVSPFHAVMRIPIKKQTSFFQKHGQSIISSVLFAGFTGFLIWSLWRRGSLPGFRKAKTASS